MMKTFANLLWAVADLEFLFEIVTRKGQSLIRCSFLTLTSAKGKILQLQNI